MESKPLIAAVLAGGQWKGEPPAGVSPWRALAGLNGRPMISYVLDAVAGARSISETVLVAPEEVGALYPGIKRLEPGISVTANVFTACHYARGRARVLLVGSDIPLLTTASIEAFTAGCGDAGVVLYYSILERAQVLKRYPRMKRTFVRLQNGTYTGGNVMLGDPDFLLERGPRIEALYAARKQPLRLAAALGAELSARAVLQIAMGVPVLTVRRAEALVGRALGGQVAAVDVPYPELGADLDSVDEIALFEELLNVGTPAAH